MVTSGGRSSALHQEGCDQPRPIDVFFGEFSHNRHEHLPGLRQWFLGEVEETDAVSEQLDGEIAVGEVTVLVGTDDQRIPSDAVHVRQLESDLPVPEPTVLVHQHIGIHAAVNNLHDLTADFVVERLQVVFDLDFADLPVFRIDEDCSHFSSSPLKRYLLHSLPSK